MPRDLSDDKSTLVKVMAWCRQATNYYLNQCWPRSPTPYGVTRPQWVWRCIDTLYIQREYSEFISTILEYRLDLWHIILRVTTKLLFHVQSRQKLTAHDKDNLLNQPSFYKMSWSLFSIYHNTITYKKQRHKPCSIRWICNWDEALICVTTNMKSLNNRRNTCKISCAETKHFCEV